MVAASAAAGSHRALYISRVGYLGGVERVLLTLAAHWEPRGSSAVLGPAGGELERAARVRGVPFLAAPIERSRITASVVTNLSYPGRWWQAARAIEAACAGYRPDLIHAHHPATVLQAAWAARRHGIPILFHVHEIGPAKPLYRMALAAAVRAATRVVCVSGAGLDLVRSVRPPARVAAKVLHNGVDPEFERRADAVPSSADVAGLGPHVAVFAVLEPRKGQDVLLRAVEEVRRTHPNVHVWLVGGAALEDKADYVDALRQAAAAPGLAGAVTLTGHRDDVVALMKAMDVVVLPSVAHESLSMVLLEALMLGRPVVATRVGGAAEAIHEGTTGLLVEPGDPGALAAAILRMLGPDGVEMARAARRDAEARFSSCAFLARVRAAYDGLWGLGERCTP